MSVRRGEVRRESRGLDSKLESGGFAPVRRAILALLALGLGPAGTGWGETVILENGVIWTGDAARPWAEAVGIENARIVAVGPRAEVSARVSPEAVRIDLGGAFVCPGLVDAHAHVIGLGRGLERIDLTGAKSLEETLGRVRAGILERRERQNRGWVQGRGWDQNDWSRMEFPSRRDLDPGSGDLAVALTRVDGHALWVNTRALALAGITRDTPDPGGGKILRDPAGEPTGILIDNAMDLVDRVLPEPGREDDRAAILRAGKLLAQAGITGVHDMGMSAAQADLYREMARKGELRVRIVGAIGSTDPDLREVLRRGPDREWVGEGFRLTMVKFFIDGALGSRGAALLAPYHDDPGNRGLLLVDPDSLRQGLEAALDAGFQCAVHAIGDRGNRLLLDTWASLCASRKDLAGGRPAPPAPLSAIGEVPATRPAIRLEHAQILAPEDIARVGGLGVLAGMQPTHCTSDMPWAPDRLGPERLAGAYAWRSVIDAGAVLAAGSDFPVESHDPRYGLYAAVTRRQPDGTPPRSWSPGQRLSREEALAAFTAAPAYASGDLRDLGTLTPGKLADFVIWDRNLVTCDPEEILGARTLLTAVGGRLRWIDENAGFADLARTAFGEVPR